MTPDHKHDLALLDKLIAHEKKGGSFTLWERNFLKTLGTHRNKLRFTLAQQEMLVRLGKERLP